MSRKSNRLKNRLRIWEERAARLKQREQSLARNQVLQLQEQDQIDKKRRKLTDEQDKLERSVALRMKVKRDFEHAYGNVWVINIRLHPDEFKIASRQVVASSWQAGIVPLNASQWAAERGYEAGKQVEKVILGVLVDGPEKWEGL